VPGSDALAAAGSAWRPGVLHARYNVWCVTRYEDLVAVLRDPDTYSSRKTINLDKLPPDLLSAFPDGLPDHVLVSLDPPDHTRLRGLARNAFTPKLVEAREAEVRTCARR
jgi:cytochrome P450